MIDPIDHRYQSDGTGFSLLSHAMQDNFIAQSALILDSYRRLLGYLLLPSAGDAVEAARELYEAPFAVLSHGTQADPILNYANRIALSLWQTTPDVLLTMPSRLTAEPMAQAAREKLMSEVARTGFVTGYEGVRISATGRRFRIENVTIFNLTAPDGTFAGQAAVFDTWHDV